MTTPGGQGPYGEPPESAPRYVDPLTGQPISSPQHGVQPQDSPQYPGCGPVEQTAPTAYPGMIGSHPATGNRPFHLGLAIAASVLVLAVSTVVVLTRGTGDTAGPAPEPIAAPLTTSSTEPTDPGPPPSSEQTTVPAVVPGWTGVAWPRFDIAYDVPPGWQPEPGMLSGVENDSGESELLSANTTYLKGACPDSPGSHRGKIGVTTSPQTVLERAGREKIEAWARLGFSADSTSMPPLRPHPTVPVRVDGDTDAILVSATVTPSPGSQCPAPSVYLSALVFPGNDGSAMLFALADQEIPGATPPDSVDRMLRSFRHLPN